MKHISIVNRAYFSFCATPGKISQHLQVGEVYNNEANCNIESNGYFGASSARRPLLTMTLLVTKWNFAVYLLKGTHFVLSDSVYLIVTFSLSGYNILEVAFYTS